jgi:hypothetical protein
MPQQIIQRTAPPVVQPAPIENEPFFYLTDIATLDLDNTNNDSFILVDNQADYSGVLRLNLDTTLPVGSSWNLNVLYGFNGGTQFTQGTSLVVAYGANGETVTLIRNIADHQSILQVVEPQVNGTMLKGGTIQPFVVGPDLVTESIGIANRLLFISTVTAATPFAPAPNANGEAGGSPTLTNYGVTLAVLSIRYVGVRFNPRLATTAPTFLINATNSYFVVANQ